MRPLDVVGLKFNRLTVLDVGSEIWRKRRQRVCLCRCDCGNLTRVSVSDLRSGKTKGCGCMKKVQFERLKKAQIVFEQFPTKKETSRNRNLLNTYGISLHEYRACLKKQGGTCAICKRVPNENKKAFGVDHEHGTKGRAAVRGVLCDFCNRKLLTIFEHYRIKPEAVVAYLNNPPFQQLLKEL